MISMWWMLGTFVLGCYVGIAVFALMTMSSQEDEHSISGEQAALRGFGPMGASSISRGP